MKKFIVISMLICFVALVYAVTMRINLNDGSYEDFEITNIESITFSPTTYDEYRMLVLQNATINGQTVTGNAPEFIVAPGGNITGNCEVYFETTFPGSHVFPLALTPNWGDKQNVYWQAQNDMSSGNNYTAVIDIVAPSIPGTYYLLLAVNSEYNAGQIASATHWSSDGPIVWDDGNDLFDLEVSDINIGISSGMLLHPMLVGPEVFSDCVFGLTAIKIIVQ
jgi:hypothetical protein